MNVRDCVKGAVLSFSYERADGTERPGHGVFRRSHKMAGGWLIVVFDRARNAERSFWEHRMSRVQIDQDPVDVVAVLATGLSRKVARIFARHAARSLGYPVELREAG